MPPYAVPDFGYCFHLYTKEEKKMTKDEEKLKNRTDRLHKILQEQGYITVGQFGRVMDVEDEKEDEDKIYLGNKNKYIEETLYEIRRVAWASLNSEDAAYVRKLCESIEELLKEED